MASNDPRLKTAERKRLRTRVAAQRRPCHKCGCPIDYTQPWHLDELLPRALGGDPLDLRNVAATHPYCNLKDSQNIRKANETVINSDVTSRAWG